MFVISFANKTIRQTGFLPSKTGPSQEENSKMSLSAHVYDYVIAQKVFMNL